jgi:hypothetical protein
VMENHTYSPIDFYISISKNEWIFNAWSMYAKTCPIPVKNVREKLIETTPLSSLLSDCIREVITCLT